MIKWVNGNLNNSIFGRKNVCELTTKLLEQMCLFITFTRHNGRNLGTNHARIIITIQIYHRQRRNCWNLDSSFACSRIVLTSKMYRFLGIKFNVLHLNLQMWKLILHFSPFQSDKVFVVGDCRFPINSVILSAFSPVFAAMFRNEMAEKNATEVEIKDVEPHDFADFLSFATFSPQPTRPNRVTFSSIFTKSRA